MMHVFETTFGPMGIDFSQAGITRIRLFEEAPPATPAKKPPRFVITAAKSIEKHLGGSPQDLGEVQLDTSGVPQFWRKVYEVAREVPAGKIIGYGELAALAGSPGGSRAVGTAMSKNPFMIVVPCHRVLASGEKLGGFSAPGGTVTKEKILALEGVFLGLPRPKLAFDPEVATRHVASKDSVLAPLIARVPYHLETSPSLSLFDALGRSIVYQQLSGKAAGTIHARYRMLFDRGRPSAEELTDLTVAQLRAVGLSENKAKALRDLGEKVRQGELPTLDALAKMDDESIIASLTKVRGIGRWTVQMILMFRLGRPDVLPIDDYGVRKGFQKIYRTRDLPTGDRITKHAEKWAPYRSVGSWYMWRALE